MSNQKGRVSIGLPVYNGEKYLCNALDSILAQTFADFDENMFVDGLTSIVGDAFDVAVVALAPIPVLQNMAIAGAFWSIITVIVGLILTPVLLSYVPISPRFVEQMKKERLIDERREGFANRFADWLGPWLISRRGLYTVSIVTVIILVFSYYWSQRLIIGDAQVGSNLLYPDSGYNQDSLRINQNLPLINPLYVVVKGDKQRSLTDPRVMGSAPRRPARTTRRPRARGSKRRSTRRTNSSGKPPWTIH